MATTRKLLNTLFFEATMAQEDIQLKPELKSEKDKQPLSGASGVTLEDRLKELKGLLTKLGIENVSDRLVISGDEFKLISTKEQHAADSALLFDFTKITPLVDKGYVAIDAEFNGTDYCIVILAADSMADMELPDSDDPEAVKFDNGKQESKMSDQDAIKLAEEFVTNVIKTAQKSQPR